jgi:fused signal recognition particle receptor
VIANRYALLYTVNSRQTTKTFKETTINIFKKVLQRTRDTWFGRAMSLFDRSSISNETWEELEETLIAADVGVATTTKLIDAVKEQAAEEKPDGDRLRSILKE